MILQMTTVREMWGNYEEVYYEEEIIIGLQLIVFGLVQRRGFLFVDVFQLLSNLA